MQYAGLRACARKYWYIIALIVAAVIGIIVLAARHNFDPYVLLSRYGYGVILVWTFLEGETIVVIAGIFADEFGLSPWFIALSAFCGSFISDQIMFSLGKYKGQDVLAMFPRVGNNIDKAARLFKKYDVALIFGFRFVYGVRNVTPIMLGISGVNHKKFFCLNFIGASIWALTFAFGGFYAGKVFARAMETVGHGIFYALLAVLAAAGGIWFIRSRKSVKDAAARAHVNFAERDDPPVKTPPDAAAGNVAGVGSALVNLSAAKDTPAPPMADTRAPSVDGNAAATSSAAPNADSADSADSTDSTDGA